jgi:RibD C-terminal domain
MRVLASIVLAAVWPVALSFVAPTHSSFASKQELHKPRETATRAAAAAATVTMTQEAPPARALVTLKIALDQQGAVDDLSEGPKRFTSEASLDAVHRLRRDSQAVIVGVETVVRDNPSLTVRRVPLHEGQQQPLRVVLDRNLRIPEAEECTLLSDGNPTQVLFTPNKDFVFARAAEILISTLGLPVKIDSVPTDTPEVRNMENPRCNFMCLYNLIRYLICELSYTVYRVDELC